MKQLNNSPRPAHHATLRGITRRTRRLARPGVSLLLAGVTALGPGATLLPQRLLAQDAGQIAAEAPRSTQPLADPVLDVPTEFRAKRTSSWTQGAARFMLLEDDVTFAMGSYGFRADRAVVRIDDERAPGRLIHHLSIYLDNAGSLRGRGPVQAEAPRLLVTASTTGALDLATDLLKPTSEANNPLVAEAQGRFRDYLAATSRPTLGVPGGIAVVTPRMETLRDERRAEIAGEIESRAKTALAKDSEAAAAKQAEEEKKIEAAATTEAAKPGGATARAATTPGGSILPAAGQISFSADRVVFEPTGKDESALALIGHVRVLYQNFEGKPGASLSAESAVIFIAGSKLADFQSGKLRASDVKSIYLEDNVVASYEKYNVRAPRVLYDLTSNKAVVLDAVMYTWDVRREIPIYVRAAKLRQESANVWTAQQAAVTTSEFAVPHFAIAAKQITVKQDEQPGGEPPTMNFTARDTTVRVGKTPVFYWPYLSGDAAETPLRRVSASYSKNNGPLVKTAWDAFGLLGRPKPEGVDATAEIDYLGEHGPALGLNLDYTRPQMFGTFEGYLVGYDQGEDDIGNRNNIGFDGETRGYALLRHRQLLQDNWELSVEGYYVSDPTFLEEFFRDQAEESKPYENSIYAKKQEDDWAFTVLGRYYFQDFVPQTTTLQSQGYNVDKAPEAGYFREATPLWGDRLTYYTENRLGRLQIRPDEPSLRRRGFTNEQSELLFGLPRNASFEDAFDALGLNGGWVDRLDTRHEVRAPVKLSIFDVTPYVAGRVTAYDAPPFEDDSAFGEPTEDQSALFWGTVGTQIHTEFSRTYDDAESQLFNVHRIRHLIEPHVDLFLTGRDLYGDGALTYDPDVEGIQVNSGTRLGLRNTLQTQRGGPGRWRNVDWLIINTDLVFQHEEDDTAAAFDPVARFIDYRPEYSRGGDHFHSDIAWQISDTLAAVGEIIQNLETHETAEWRVGLSLQHSADLSTFIDYTEIDPLREPSRLLSFGFGYKLTRKYTMGLRQTVDLGQAKEVRSLDVTLTRKLPRWDLVVIARFDEVDNDQTIGVVLIPNGISAGHVTDPLGTLRARD